MVIKELGGAEDALQINYDEYVYDLWSHYMLT